MTYRTTLRALLCYLTLIAGGCAPDPFSLAVSLRSDLVAPMEVTEARLSATDTATGLTSRARVALEPGDDLAAGLPLAQLDVRPGTHRLDVALLDAAGQVVAERPTLVEVTGDTAITVLLTRDCREVACGDGLACHGGRCVDERCSSLDEASCGAGECAADADCAADTTCAAGTCAAGACLAVADDASCGEGLWCSPDLGCLGEAPACPELEVVEHPGGSIEADETWPAAIYELDRSLTLRDATLTLSPCTTIRMPERGSITVGSNGALHAEGEPSRPITITSNKSAPSRGDWSYITYEGTANHGENVLTHVAIEYGGSGDFGSLWLGRGASLRMSDSTIRESAGPAILAMGGVELRDFEGNRLLDNGAGITMQADGVDQLGPGTYGPNDTDGIVLGGTVGHDAEWVDHGTPYYAPDGFTIRGDEAPARLTVREGATLLLGPGADISVESNGGLALEGTREAPITVTSDSDTPSRGDWRYISYDSGSIDAANVLRHAVVEYGGGSPFGMIWVGNGSAVRIVDSTLRHAATAAIELTYSADLLELTGEVSDSELGIVGPAHVVGAIGRGTYGPNDTDGIVIEGGTVTRDTTWVDHGVPYVTVNGFTVGVETGSAVLSIEAGAVLAMGAGADLEVRGNGALELLGTPEAHVTIRSAKSSPAPGDWRQISIYGGAIGPRNLFRYTDVRHGGGSSFGQLWLQGGSEVTLDHATFEEAGAGCDLDLSGLPAPRIDATSSRYAVCE